MNPSELQKYFITTKGKPPLNKVNLKCRSCHKFIIPDGGTVINWDKWELETENKINYMESRAKYHILFKCPKLSFLIDA